MIKNFIITLLCALCAAGVQAADISQYVTVTDFKLLKSDGSEISVSNPGRAGTMFKIEVSWTVNMTSGVIQNGDYFMFPVPITSPGIPITYASSSFVDFKDISGVTLGQWRIINGGDYMAPVSLARRIRVELGPGAAGMVALSGSFSTGLSFQFSNQSEGIRDVTAGNLTKQIMITTAPRSLLQGEHKWLSSASNGIVTWGFDFGNDGFRELSASNGATYTSVQNNIIVEDTLVSAISAESVDARLVILLPMSDSNPAPAEVAPIFQMPIPSIVRIYQNVSESYADFKARLSPWQWGAYTTATGEIIVVAHLGNLPADFIYQNYATAAGYSDLGLYIHDKAVEPAVVTPAIQAMFNSILGTGNAVQGKSMYYRIYIIANYEPVIFDTQIPNRAKVTYTDHNSLPVTQYRSATGTLKGVSGEGTPSLPMSVTLVKSDNKNATQLLEGASFRLQRLNGAAWTNYVTHDTGGDVRATNAAGMVNFTALEQGTYRFVEVQAAPGYNRNTVIYSPETFTITAEDASAKIVYATNALAILPVNPNVRSGFEP
ncbi:MAG: prealbumin-like fold domain-containing protein [Prevotellaceae bacterium]|jgi:hypothetical protein|nr:prealbumin-like fold domain-containing protein [Prevotellaceae bacterium]